MISWKIYNVFIFGKFIKNIGYHDLHNYLFTNIVWQRSIKIVLETAIGSVARFNYSLELCNMYRPCVNCLVTILQFFLYFYYSCFYQRIAKSVRWRPPNDNVIFIQVRNNDYNKNVYKIIEMLIRSIYKILLSLTKIHLYYEPRRTSSLFIFYK